MLIEGVMVVLVSFTRLSMVEVGRQTISPVLTPERLSSLCGWGWGDGGGAIVPTVFELAEDMVGRKRGQRRLLSWSI